jgi:GNAT superfamily N-acetyltransferase
VRRRAGPPGRRQAAAPRIRLATRRDATRVAGLMARSPLLRRYGATAALALDAVRRGLAAGDRLLVATAPRGHLLGMAWIVPSRALTGAAYLRLLLVEESRQQTGIGARLLAAAETAARRRANHLALLATTDNVRARRFYERHGYRYVGDLPGLARAGLDEALYWKTLRPHGTRLSV